MASAILMRVSVGDDPVERDGARAALAAALQVMHTVDRTCTRFDQRSDLMRANTDPQAWHEVTAPCFDALVAAHAAHRRTFGAFDPRVLDDLVRLGYDRSLRVGSPSARDASALEARSALPPWRPEFRRSSREVRLGAHRVDLGGIGKGLAVRWASARLAGVGHGHLVDAGGDCRCVGAAPDGGPWRVAIENPDGGDTPVAVLGLGTASVATSSVRIRQWSIAGRPVHHLIDPKTGQPGGAGLRAVSVVSADPADAEVWSKTLFLTGRRGIATSAAHHGLAALWVADDGAVETSRAMQPHLLWTAS